MGILEACSGAINSFGGSNSCRHWTYIAGATSAITLTYAVYEYWKHKLTVSRLPILYQGKLTDILFGGDPIDLSDRAEAVAKQLGSDIFTASSLKNYFVFISDYTILRRLFVDKSKFTSGRFQNTQYGWWKKVNYGVVNNDDLQDVQHIRKLIMKALGTVGFGKAEIEKKIVGECVACVDSLLEASQNKSPVNITSYATTVTLNVILSMSYGTTFKHCDPYLERLKDCNFLVTDYGIFPDIRKSLPFEWMTKIPILRNKEFDEFLDAFNTILNLGMELMQQRLREPGRLIENSDLLGILLNSPSHDGKPYQSRTIIATMLDTFIAGSETSANTVSWAVKALANNQELQERLYKELKDLNPNALSVNDITAHNLHFTNAVVHEALRCCSPAPTLVPHLVHEQFTLDHRGTKWTFPRGCVMIGNALAIHKNPQLWKDPFNFNPDNFLDSATGKFCCPEYFLPFGVGPRNCVGENLAKTEVFIIVAFLVINFKLEKPPGVDWDMNKALGNLIRRADNFTVILSQR